MFSDLIIYTWEENLKVHDDSILSQLFSFRTLPIILFYVKHIFGDWPSVSDLRENSYSVGSNNRTVVGFGSHLPKLEDYLSSALHVCILNGSRAVVLIWGPSPSTANWSRTGWQVAHFACSYIPTSISSHDSNRLNFSLLSLSCVSSTRQVGRKCRVKPQQSSYVAPRQ
jgi:hypothetical protein